MMLPQLLLLLLACTLRFTEALADDSRAHGKEPWGIRKRQHGGAPYPITGIQTGQVLPRVEIRDLQDNYPDQFNILLLGWRKLQEMNQSDFLSYFRIAGIHGVPSSDWNGVHGVKTQNPGYCAHVSNVFLPWHRPYLALFEQNLVEKSQEAATEFPPGPQRDQYLNAAALLRLPYWDWAMDPQPGQNAIPDSISQPTIEVTTPNGMETITNPLYSYLFHPIDPGLQYQPYLQWRSTLRWPTDRNTDAQTQISDLVEQLNAVQPSVKLRVYTLLTYYQNFTEFGNSAWIRAAGPGSYDSLESVHNQVHGTVRGMNYGDMSVIPVSAFDPSFWFHHCMVDRLFAIWQALNPESYVESETQTQSTYWYKVGDILDADSALKPFYSDAEGDFWTSNTCRDTNALGYTYPELTSDSQDDVRTAVNILYGSNSPGPQTKMMKPKHKRSLRLAGHEKTSSEAAEYLYQINIRAPKNSIDSSLFIDFFVGSGPESEDPSTWLQDPNLIGSHALLSMKIPEMPQVTITGVIMLNRKLESMMAQGRLCDMEPKTVLKMLQDNIAWRIKTGDGQAVPIEMLADFKVAVSSIEVSPAREPHKFPTYIGDWEVHPEVTHGKEGGLHFDDPI